MGESKSGFLTSSFGSFSSASSNWGTRRALLGCCYHGTNPGGEITMNRMRRQAIEARAKVVHVKLADVDKLHIAPQPAYVANAADAAGLDVASHLSASDVKIDMDNAGVFGEESAKTTGVLILRGIQLSASAVRQRYWTKTEPYVVCRQGSSLHYETLVARQDDADPAWDFSLPFLCPRSERWDADYAEDLIHIRIMDSNLLSPDTHVDEVMLCASSLAAAAMRVPKRRRKRGVYVCVRGELSPGLELEVWFEFERWNEVFMKNRPESEPPQWDDFLSVLVTGTILASADHNQLSNEHVIQPPVPREEAPPVVEIVDGLMTILADDPDVPYAQSSGHFFHFLNSLPFRMQGHHFRSRVEAEAYMSRLMSNMQAVGISPEGTWAGDMTSDASLSRFCFAHCGTKWLHRLEGGKGGYECRMLFMERSVS